MNQIAGLLVHLGHTAVAHNGMHAMRMRNRQKLLTPTHRGDDPRLAPLAGQVVVFGDEGVEYPYGVAGCSLCALAGLIHDRDLKPRARKHARTGRPGEPSPNHRDVSASYHSRL